MSQDKKISLPEAPVILSYSMRDPSVPLIPKLLVMVLLACILSPVGLLPEEKLQMYRRQQEEVHDRSLSLPGLVLILVAWLLCLVTGYVVWQGY